MLASLLYRGASTCWACAGPVDTVATGEDVVFSKGHSHTQEARVTKKSTGVKEALPGQVLHHPWDSLPLPTENPGTAVRFSLGL